MLNLYKSIDDFYKRLLEKQRFHLHNSMNLYDVHMNIPREKSDTTFILFYYILLYESLINAYSHEQDTFLLLSLSMYNNTTVKQS